MTALEHIAEERRRQIETIDEMRAIERREDAEDEFRRMQRAQATTEGQG